VEVGVGEGVWELEMEVLPPTVAVLVTGSAAGCMPRSARVRRAEHNFMFPLPTKFAIQNTTVGCCFVSVWLRTHPWAASMSSSPLQLHGQLGPANERSLSRVHCWLLSEMRAPNAEWAINQCFTDYLDDNVPKFASRGAAKFVSQLQLNKRQSNRPQSLQYWHGPAS